MYLPERKIGSGAFATAYRCRNGVALKVYEEGKGEGHDAGFRAASEAIRDHSHTVRFIESFWSGGRMCVAMTLAEGEDLHSMLLRHPDGLPDPLPVVRDLLAALAACAEAGVVHGDVKPENLVVGPRRAVLCDFDNAAVGTRLRGMIQTREYRAPEVEVGRAYGPEADVWSAACTAYEAVTGEVLFPLYEEGEGLRHRELIEAHIRRIGPYPRGWTDVSLRGAPTTVQPLPEFLRPMLRYRNRASAVQSLAHPGVHG